MFSCWTRTLDILVGLLEEHHITFARIDGEVSFAERATRLVAFQENPAVSILLMTMGTGALG